MPHEADELARMLQPNENAEAATVRKEGSGTRRWALVMIALAIADIVLLRICDAHDQSSTLLRGAMTALMLVLYMIGAAFVVPGLLLLFAVLALVKRKALSFVSVSYATLFGRAVLIPAMVLTILYYGLVFLIALPCAISDLCR